MTEERVCGICKKPKPLTLQYFPDKAHGAGLRRQCRECLGKYPYLVDGRRPGTASSAARRERRHLELEAGPALVCRLVQPNVT